MTARCGWARSSLGQGALTRQELDDYMRLQIEEAVYYLFTWTTGAFNFEAGVRPDPRDFQVQINPEWLLLEGARRVDEWSLIEKKIPSFDLIFTADQARVEAAGAPLSEQEQQILPLLDGRHDVQQVVDESGLVEFVVGQALYSLITAGYRASHRLVGDEASRRGSTMRGSRSIGTSASRSTARACWTRRCASSAAWRNCGPTEGSAPFYLGLIALRQAQVGGRRRGVQARGGEGRPAPRGAAQPRLRAGAAGPARGGGSGVRRRHEPRARRPPDHAAAGRSRHCSGASTRWR